VRGTVVVPAHDAGGCGGASLPHPSGARCTPDIAMEALTPTHPPGSWLHLPLVYLHSSQPGNHHVLADLLGPHRR
uniref:Uncharacterized protein n=1 Tax=Aegilops tauschii subsp. strangulata TaxID=200361 RepID=A0A452ZF76_AEGTS